MDIFKENYFRHLEFYFKLTNANIIVHCILLKLIFVTGSCTEACTVLSSGTASPYSRSSSSSSLLVPNSSCTCQCNFDLPIFREDLHICVNDIHGNVQNFFVMNYEVIYRGMETLRQVTARTFSCYDINDFRLRLPLHPLASWSKSSSKNVHTADADLYGSFSRI